MGEHKSNPFARHTQVVRPSITKDAYGRELHAGDLVKVRGLRDFDPVFQILDVQPNLHLQAQPNTVIVRLSAPLTIVCAAAEREGRLLRVATHEELTPAAETESPAETPEGATGDGANPPTDRAANDTAPDD